MTIAYVPNPYSSGELPDKGGQGWLQVRLEPGGNLILLPMYLKVRIEAKLPNGAADRDYFTILEGPHNGKKASVSFKEVSQCDTYFATFCVWWSTTKTSRFLGNLTHNSPCTVQYRKVKPVTEGFKAITEKSKVQVGTGSGANFVPVIPDLEVIHQFDLLKPGTYKLKIPDYDHTDKAQKYVGQSKFATTWYPVSEPLYLDDPATVEQNEKGLFSRYFHPGRGSAGCLTVIEVNRWDQVVEFVSMSRLDTDHVGYVEILSE